MGLSDDNVLIKSAPKYSAESKPLSDSDSWRYRIVWRLHCRWKCNEHRIITVMRPKSHFFLWWSIHLKCDDIFYRTLMRSSMLWKCDEILHRTLLWWKIPEFRSVSHYSVIINAFKVQWNIHRAARRDKMRVSHFGASSHFVVLKLSHF